MRAGTAAARIGEGLTATTVTSMPIDFESGEQVAALDYKPDGELMTAYNKNYSNSWVQKARDKENLEALGTATNAGAVYAYKVNRKHQ